MLNQVSFGIVVEYASLTRDLLSVKLFCDIISLKTDDKKNAQSRQSVNADVSTARV